MGCVSRVSENRDHRTMPADRTTNSAVEDEEACSGLLKLAVAGLAVGALAGLVGCAFHFAVDHTVALRSAVVAWSFQTPTLGWLAPVALCAAGVARWLVRRFAPEASGSGVQHVEAVVQGEARRVRARVLPVKFIGGALALGPGLALGREGPTMQMGATLGRMFARHFGLLGVAYNRLVVAGLDVAERMHRIAPEVRAALVGGVFGLLACVTPALAGGGETLIQSVLDGSQSVAMLMMILAARLVLGPLSYAAGLSGGLFAPLLVVGAAAGALYGHALEASLPVLTTPTAAYAAVGMGALFVGVVRAPVTGIALIVEMTGATTLFIPLLTASAAAVAVPTVLGDPAIYDALRLRDAAHRREQERGSP
jgi:chloride channel protein, CIC family